MPAPILIKHATALTPVPMPLVGLHGEMAFATGGFTDLPNHIAAGTDMIISDGTAHKVLVGPSRQVELIGAQAIVGRKTFSLASLGITGGAANDHLVTDGAGQLAWEPLASAAVTTDGVTITGDGDATAIALITGIFTGVGSGLTYAPGAVSVVQATQALFGGVFISTDLEIDAGTDDTSAVSPRGLMYQLGLPASGLTTTATEIVPAINELQTALLALTGVLVMCGSYDVAGDVVASGNPIVPSGVLPPASAANNAAYLIIVTSGTGTGNAPAVPMTAGSWLVSDGTAWVYIDIAQGVITADSVVVNPVVAGAANVQDALEALEAQIAAITVITDGVSIDGDGTAGNEITLIMVDGGTF